VTPGGDRTPVSWFVIERGWKVVGSDAAEIGRVDEVAGDTGKDIFSGIVVSEGLLKGRRFIPAERVTQIVDGEVHVDLGSADAEQLAAYDEPAAQEQILAPDREQ
jgi:hypothetical protein